MLIDTSRKLVVDTFKVPLFDGRRIIDMSSATIEWVGTQITYVAVAARGSPVVQIVIFKHNENKMRHLYTINTLPELPNFETPEMNPKQSYTEFPCKVKFSVDFNFLAVVTCSGSVHLLKMPSILNPLSPE